MAILMDCRYLHEHAHILGSWLYPKNLDAAVAYLEGKLADLSRIVLYGAGTHSQLLWEKLSPTVTSKIIRILDVYPEGKNFPVPVQHPKEFFQSGDSFDLIVLSHFDFENSMQDTLHSLGVSDDKILSIYINEEYNASLKQSVSFPSLVNRDGKKVVALVTMRGDRKIMNDGVIAELTRDSRFVFVNLDMGREKTERQDLYEIYYDCQRSIYQLLNAIQDLQPDIVYVHDQIETLYFLPRLLMRCMPGLSVVWEPYDLLHLMIEDYSVLGVDKALSPEEIAFVRENECYALEYSTGLVFKEIGPLAETVYYQERTRPSLYFNQYLDSYLIAEHESVYRAPYRLVYAGTIDPSRDEDVFTGDNYLLGEFELLLAQGLYLDVFLTCEEQVIPIQYSAYQALAGEYPAFRMHPRRPLEQLIPELSGEFHFGIQIGRCDAKMLEVNQRRYSSTFSAKLWSYLFAGLPVIVNDELEGMAEFVRQHDIGITVSCHRHEDIRNVLAGITQERYGEMAANVRQLAQDSSAEKMSSVMAEFLANVASKI